METATSLELIAARLRVEAGRLERAVVGYVEPAMRMLPEVWIGPAADQLEGELFDHRRVLLAVADRLCARAGSLELQAGEIRAAQATAALGGAGGAI